MNEALPPQPGPRSARRRAGGVAFVVLGALALAACGSGAAGSQGTSTSTPGSPAGGGSSTTTSALPCPHLAAHTTPARAGTPVVLDFAAMLTATITVDPGTGTASCALLRPGSKIHLLVGQRVEFVANHAPSVSDVPPAAGAGAPAVSVTTAPGPTSTGPDGALPTAHVLVTVTAVHPGTVRLAWIDCSGTAC